MSAIIIRLVILIFAFATVFLLSQAFLRSRFNRRSERRAVNRRLELLKAGTSSDDVIDILRKGVPDRLPADATLPERLYYRFQRMVRLADLRVEPQTLALGCSLGFVALCSVILLFAWASGRTITFGILELTFVIAFAFTVIIPLLYVRRRMEKHRRRMEEQFPVALDVFTRALRAGHPVASAIDLLTTEMEDPIGSEFGLVSDQVAYGLPLTDALLEMADRWDLQDIRMFVVSLSLQSETGGNLAEVLSNLSAVIRDRMSIYMKVRALSSEGRMSGWMLSALPVFTILVLFTFNPSFYLEVAGDPIFVYGFTGLLLNYALGVFMIRRMIDLKV
ncbi:type II secretion system F family protein [Novosphingobium sp.]|uniref:type II secretion system F family protein n=1 Tax=Novosphingobium sp. TaxID=1874826 RepID=UPI00286AD74B|nr:type II secretion system F family protein [Novosphingobium sp.]